LDHEPPGTGDERVVLLFAGHVCAFDDRVCPLYHLACHRNGLVIFLQGDRLARTRVTSRNCVFGQGCGPLYLVWYPGAGPIRQGEEMCQIVRVWEA
jgi:hypothetical protein